MSPKVLWDVVRAAAARAGIDKLAPHDLRRHAGWRFMPDSATGGSRSTRIWASVTDCESA
jgi:hypothetical protein